MQQKKRPQYTFTAKRIKQLQAPPRKTLADRFDNYLLFVARNPQHFFTLNEWNDYEAGKRVPFQNELKILNILARRAERLQRSQRKS